MWKQIEGYNYEVSEDGQVRNMKTGRILKPRELKGYLTVRISNNKKEYTASIHRLIAQAYIPNTENKPCIDHIDRNTKNNSISNLRWVTHSENTMNRHIMDMCKNIRHKKGGYQVEVMRQSKRNNKWFKKLEDAEAYLEELKSTIIINGVK